VAEFQAAADLPALEQARVNYLGAHGKFTGLLKQLGSLPKDQKPAAGKAVNTAKVELESALAQRKGESKSRRTLPKRQLILRCRPPSARSASFSLDPGH